ncbi:MAG: alpha-galactosidase [Lentisphaeria bacterium]|nr:alpha-galactosidase [Lentisphaeria bacterium]
MKSPARTSLSPVLAEFSFREKSGVFSFVSQKISLEKAMLSIQCGKTLLPLKEWKLAAKTIGDAEHTLLEYETENTIGKFFLAFAVTCEEVTVSLSAKLKKSFPHITFFYFREASCTLPNHILARSLNLPGARTAAVLPGTLEKSMEFSSFDSTLTTGGDHQLFLTFPMAPEHVPEITHKLRKHFSRITLSLTAKVALDHFGEREITLPPLALRFCSPEEHPAFPPFRAKLLPEKEIPPPPCAWNSWDYYRWTVTEEEVLKNAEKIASDPVLSRYVKRIIVDDGWEYAYGEWVSNGLFPSGMEKLADRLAKMGFEPGLWIAPGIAEGVSRIAQMQYDLLAKSEDGVPAILFSCMERKGFVLDPTNEKVHAFWAELFQKYVSMGYKYFKLDFLAAMMNIPIPADKTVPRGRYLKILFETVQRAVNGQAHFTACGYPYFCGNPGAEAVRVGGDIHARWDSVKANASVVASTYPFGGTCWVNDPDFALCRGKETSSDPDLTKMRPCLVYNRKEGGNNPAWSSWTLADITEEETKVLLSLVLASGGARTLSDAVYFLNEEGLLLARKLVSAAPGLPAVPLDLFQTSLPSVFLQNLAKGAFRVLFINWTEEEKEFSLELEKRFGLSASWGRDFWREAPLRLTKGVLRKTLAPHSCLLAEIFP